MDINQFLGAEQTPYEHAFKKVFDELYMKGAEEADLLDAMARILGVNAILQGDCMKTNLQSYHRVLSVIGKAVEAEFMNDEEQEQVVALLLKAQPNA